MFRFGANHPLLNFWRISEILPDKRTEDTNKVWLRARSNLLKAHGRSKQVYDKNRSDNPFQTGDLVLLRAHVISSKVKNISSKMSQRWRGPFEIQSWLTPVTVSLIDPSTGNFVQKAHVSQIKKYFPR